MTIGIPRALLYWKRPYFWETFFKELGFEVLLSPKTNKEIVEMGVKAADPETCFSQKVYWGHLLWLDGKCDFIFVPRLKTNAEKLEYCPKFFGLPDLAKILVKTQILTETFDERREKFAKTIERLGKRLNKNKKEVRKAAETAFLKEKEIKEKEGEEFFKKFQSGKKKIILVSHPYNLEDEYVNLRIKEKLEKLGAEPIFIDEISDNEGQSLSCPSPVPLLSLFATFCINLGTNFTNISGIRGQIRENSRNVKFHWEFGKEIMERIDFLFSLSREKNFRLSGAIEISSFACGCDAVLKEFVEKKFKTKKIPFLYLIIDEQTGEVGLQTRLEAFIDTIR